jgi:molecular chaperone GrpE
MEENNIEEIRKKAERFESQFNKLKQEFKDYIENSRRNEETKRQELKIDSAKKLLVTADSLSRISVAYDNISCDSVKSYSENLKKNIDVIYAQLLSASGITPIEPEASDKFDERIHMAIGLEYGTAYPENSVFRVIRKGYRIENNVIRPAEVIVSKLPVEVIKIKKPSLMDRILGWINPTKLRIAEINQRIDTLEQLQRGNIGRLTQDMDSLKNTITQMGIRNQKVDELERIQNEKIEKLILDIISLRDIIMKFEENIALEEQIPLQGSDVSNNAEQ